MVPLITQVNGSWLLEILVLLRRINKDYSDIVNTDISIMKLQTIGLLRIKINSLIYSYFDNNSIFYL